MRFIRSLLVLLVISYPVAAQTVILRGQVVDQNGAVIPSSTVTVNGASGLVKTTTTGANGMYSITGELAHLRKKRALNALSPHR